MSAGDSFLKWKQRAEQAERERAEVVGWLADVTEALTGERPTGVMPSTTLQAALDLKARAEHAEADNAALHERIAVIERELYLEHFETAHRMAGDLVREQHPGAALLERLMELEAVIRTFRDVEWARGDWQGVCPFRRHKDVLCPGTDGRVAAVGTSSPVPHAEGCPYHALNALKEREP